MDNEPLLTFDRVSFCYEEAGETPPAIEDVSFTLHKGEFLAVLGHNGSGKSTLAKLANGICVPTEGRALVLGMDTALPEYELDVRKSVGVVFQNPDNQIVASIVEEDVAFGPENLGLPQREIRRRVDDALAAVGMTAYAQHETHRLSGGQKQRVAIAGIIAMRPKCLVLDEPTAMLDPRGRADILQTVRSLNQTLGISVIYITHFMEEAVFADRILLMDHGRIAGLDTPSAVLSNAEKLLSLGLELPDPARLSVLLREQGVGLSQIYITEEALVDDILSLLRG